MDITTASPITSEFTPDPNPDSGIYRDIINLSGGTMATLTGESTYISLEAIQAKFAFFYLENFNTKWEDWIDVWNDFVAEKES